jgi:hypothetical protein
MSTVSTLSGPEQSTDLCLRSKRPQVRILPGAPLSNDLQPSLPNLDVCSPGQTAPQTEHKPCKPIKTRIVFGDPQSIRLAMLAGELLEAYRVCEIPWVVSRRVWWTPRVCDICSRGSVARILGSFGESMAGYPDGVIRRDDLVVTAGSLVAHERCFVRHIYELRLALRLLGYDVEAEVPRA